MILNATPYDLDLPRVRYVSSHWWREHKYSETETVSARINASLVNTGREVLTAVAQGFGLGVPANANTQNLGFALREHVEEQTAVERAVGQDRRRAPLARIGRAKGDQPVGQSEHEERSLEAENR